MNFFKEDLKYSNSDRDFWNRFYRKAFPSLVGIRMEKRMSRQRMGIDVEISFPNDGGLFIEEKTRKKNYGDILLEYISNDKSGAAGWMEKNLKCDYIAYRIVSKGIVYLLPWEDLREAWISNKDVWLSTYPRIVANNPSYKTISVGVPISTLKRHFKISAYKSK